MVCNVFYVFVQSVWLDLVLDLVLVISTNPSEDSSVRIVCSARIPLQLKTCFITETNANANTNNNVVTACLISQVVQERLTS